MTNFEKVKEEMRIEDTGGCMVCQAIHRLKNEGSCYNRTCEECQKWLAEEYVESIILTEAERVILQNVDKKYKYIARDENSELYIYEKQPIKEYDFWEAQSDYCRLKRFEHLFQFVQWEDTEPYEIAELLEG